MAVLVADVLTHREDAEAMGALARSARMKTAKMASRAFAGAVPAIVDRLAETTSRTDGATALLRVARSLTWSERSDPANLFATPNQVAGEEIVKLLFGASASTVVETLADGVDSDKESAEVLLEIASTFVLAKVADPAQDLTLERFLHLIRQGTGSPSPSRPAAAVAPATGAAAAAVAVPTAAADGEGKKRMLIGAGLAAALVAVVGLFTLTGGRDSTDADDLVFSDQGTTTIVTPEETTTTVELVDDIASTTTEQEAIVPAGEETPEIVSIRVPMYDIEAITPEASGVLAFDFNTVTGEVCYSVESDVINGPYRSHIHAGGFGVKGGIVVDLGPLESGATGCVDNLPVDTNAILANRENHYAELHDVTEEYTIRGQLSETINGDVVSISVPMEDTKSIAPEASGVLNFDFNTVTGEVCYSIESINIDGPYRSHIHVGPVGVDGGIVVDLGPQEPGATGCVDNLPIDTRAILLDRPGHYAELHDVTEEFTIRGQLSETVAGEVGTTPVVNENSVVDTEGGGARTVLEGGTIFLEGEVPDQATADELVASLAGVDGSTPVVNNLTVVAGAPLPSGRVVIADAIFFDVGSSTVNAIDPNTLSAITALAASRDDWILTVVGHTDDRGSDVSNLELSLRRATSVRDLLSAQGIADENLRIRGAGETAPIGDNNTEAGRAENRRIEFEFTPKG